MTSRNKKTLILEREEMLLELGRSYHPEGIRPAFSNNPYWTIYENYENDTRSRVIANTFCPTKLQIG
jgi:hypothetical protein